MFTTILGISVLLGAADSASPSSVAVHGQANVMVEIAFTASHDYRDAFQEVALDLRFETPEGRTIQVPAFWAGGRMPFYGSKHAREESAMQKAGWTDVIRSMRATDPFHRMITIHPSRAARDTVADPSLLDFDMHQTGHSPESGVGKMARQMRSAYVPGPLSLAPLGATSGSRGLGRPSAHRERRPALRIGDRDEVASGLRPACATDPCETACSADRLYRGVVRPGRRWALLAWQDQQRWERLLAGLIARLET